ncbi:hypothetical protein H5410_033246 [Solanum commersonii]|uniref:Ionotropic glutamate receptor C-terminal domain-containing protein n=1 Tax=Solanum commersonii TaxID=4109 RepID=A0A9J5YS03_SOLCO|nr:hypothetical protein H5410_033246 [Solanum commersonii]
MEKEISSSVSRHGPNRTHVFGLWEYDNITSLAEAVEKLGTTAIPKLKKQDTRENLTDLDAHGMSTVGSLLADSMGNTVLKQGLSGDFHIIDGELQPLPYQIVNIIGKGEKSIGFWMEKDDISCKLKNGKTAANCNNKKLGAIFWPGESAIVPRGWEMPPNVFKEVILSLPYAIPYEFIPFPIQDPLTLPDYDDLVHKITSKLQVQKLYHFEDYDDALSRGSKNGGVGAIVDELPYLGLFLNKYCRKYIMVGQTYKAAGFGFAFPKGSPLVPYVSRAVLKVMEGEFMNNIIQKWFGNETDCPQKDETDSLTLDSFKGLFLIAVFQQAPLFSYSSSTSFTE